MAVPGSDAATIGLLSKPLFSSKAVQKLLSASERIGPANLVVNPLQSSEARMPRKRRRSDFVAKKNSARLKKSRSAWKNAVS